MADIAKTDNVSPATSMLVQLTTDGVPKLHCPVCDKALTSLNGYVNHVKKHEPPGGFLCRYCDERFCSEDALKKHRDEIHTTIICRLCTGVTFTNESDYREHIRIIHNGIDREMYKCDKCGAEYKTLLPFKRHLETECGTIKPFKCDQCPMSFVTKYNLKQHKELHTGERKYCCSYCGKNFLQKGRLIEHERSHTGEKPHKCDVCGKCFAHRESIVTHSSIHTGIRLVECKCCHTRFSCHSNLIKHRRTRPDTCGLPEFDPPKERVRKKNRLRIPPTLNPTSEIKVSNSNRIIKPDHKDQMRQTKTKKDIYTKMTARKSTAGKPGRKPGKRKCQIPETDTEEEENDENKHEEASTRLDILTTMHQTKSPQSGFENVISEKLEKSERDSDDDYAGFDPVDSEGDDYYEHEENAKFSLPKFEEIKEENGDDEVEFIEAELSFKSEDGKSLDSLLNDAKNEGMAQSDNQQCKEHVSGLHETELIIIKNENSINYVEETDVLDVDTPASSTLTACKIILRDICQRYPQLKEESSINVSTIAPTFPRPQRKKSAQAQKAYTMDTDSDECLLNMSKQSLNIVNQVEPTAVVAKKTKRGRKARKQTETVNTANSADEHEEIEQLIDGINEENELSTEKSPLKTEFPKEPNKRRRLAKLSQKELKMRLKLTKRREKPYQCPYCIKVYYISKPFEKHLRNDHKRPEEEIKESLKMEEFGINDGEVFKCHICSKIYLMEKRLESHIMKHGPDGSLIFKCPCYCALYFATKDEATTHARKEHHDMLYCNICEKYMTGHDSLKNHIRKHEQEKDNKSAANRNFVCDKCGKKFGGRTALTDHVRSDCGRKPLYQCNVCGKHLTTSGILKTHLLLHKDDTPYQCDKCGKAFKVKAQYKTHLKTRHTDHKPFQCHLCPKAYPYRESLLTHMTVHTGIKRFLCNGCGKRFTCVSNLQAHRKVHSETCGQLPLNAKATQYMGVQKGNLLLGAKPEAGVDYKETNTLLAKEVIDRDRPMAQEINYPSEPSAPLATVPLNYTPAATQKSVLPQVITPFMSVTLTVPTILE
ncbi:unnamed protein product [Ceratitis capitata]|uniref:(Mediterranean fruit fly) hypothetical protein n=1 Tax=Ceratitis capitata TaxID=7213 RepID=A0A811UQ93_CERCA|nr:unnamed protein product [Ceratitis capitata]